MCIRDRSIQAIGALSMFVLATSLLPLTHSYLVGQIAYFMAGVGHSQIAISLNTLIQGAVPDEYRGRAVSFYLLGVLAGIPIGTQLLGSVGDAIGFRATMFLDGGSFVLIIAAMLLTGWWRDLDATPEQVEASALRRGGASTLATS